MQNRLPFVAAAFICEKVLDEKDGVLTAVRIVDTYTIKAIEIPTAGSSAKGAARNETPVAVEGPKVIDVNALIGVKSGDVSLYAGSRSSGLSTAELQATSRSRQVRPLSDTSGCA
jgi:hypothetical protein